MVKKLFWLLLIMSNMVVLADTLETEEDKMSYSLGIYAGQRLIFSKAEVGIVVDPEIYVQGMRDGILKQLSKLNDEQVNKAISYYRAKRDIKLDQQNKDSVADQNNITHNTQNKGSR